ncbi:MAG: hypothetical protein IJS47_01395 [Clostridia bacterium]|nr:hypothetical protein [Clostridia bacterium]
MRRKVRRMQKMYKEALEKSKITQKSNNNIQYDVGYDVNGKPYIEIKNDILDGVPEKEWVKKVKDVLKEKFPNGIDMEFFNISITKQSRNEYTNSKYSNKLRRNNTNLFADKMRMANNADEIVQNAYNVRNEDIKHLRKDDIVSFNRSNIDVKVGNQMYQVDVVTGITKNNNEIFYDIVNIKKKVLQNTTSVNNAQRKTGTSSINNIQQNNKSVNT